MKNKKKLIIIISVAAVVLICAAAGIYLGFIKGGKEPSLQETIDSRISAYETDLRDSLASMTDQESAAKYIATWAENKGIDTKIDRNNNVILTLDATSGFENRSPVVIICGYDYASMETYINSIVCAMTVAKNDRPHGAYRIIFLSQEGGNTQSVKELSAGYFPDNAEIFYLGNASSSRIVTATGGYEQYEVTRSLNRTESTYNKAYKITISGLPAQKTGVKSVYEPNPVKTLGNLLANFKSTSIVFELASFGGGISCDSTPSSAAVTVVINEDASEKLEKKLDSAIEKFYDKYQDKYPDASYTYEIVETPSSVLSSEDTEAIISLMYTSLNGAYYTDDNDDVAALTNIGYAGTDGDTFSMKVSALGCDADLMSEIQEAYATICVLSGMDFSVKQQYQPFVINDAGSALGKTFTEAYSIFRSTKLSQGILTDFIPGEILAGKNSNAVMLVLGVTERTKDNFAGGLVTYLEMEKISE